MGLTQKLGTIPLAILTDASNNVGIGAAPSGSYKLEVTGTGRFSSRINGVVGGTLYNTAGLWLQGSSATDGISIGGTAGGDKNIDTYGGILKLNATSGNGLSVTGAATFSSSVQAVSFVATGGLSSGLIAANTSFIDNSSGTARFLSYGANSSTRGSFSFIQASSTNTLQQSCFSIDSSGNIGIGTSSPTAYGTKNLEVNGSGSAYITVKGSSNAVIGELAADGEVYLSSKTANAIIFRTTDVERMRITSTYGAVLLGTTDNQLNTRLQVAASTSTSSNWISGTFAGTGNTDKVVIGNFSGVGATVGGHTSALTGWANLTLNFGGGAVYAGTLRIDNNSDQRFKRNITSVENALDIILKLQGRKFNMIDEDNILRYGFIAQEVQPYLSDFVTESIREYKDEEIHLTNLLTLETSGAAWAALLVEAIKELNERLNKAGL